MSLVGAIREWTPLRLPESITADVLDRAVTGIPDSVWRLPIKLDLSAATSIDVTAMQYFISILNERARCAMDTAFTVPKAQQVRDFVRAQDFPAVASIASGVSFKSLTWPQDVQYFGERRRVIAQEAARARRATTAYERLVGSRFFCFAAHVFNTEAQIESIFETEWSRWRSPLVLGFLDNALKERGAEIARVVIYEMLINAVRHAGADLLTIVPFVETVGSGRQWFSISVWDNGKPLADGVRGEHETGDSSPSRTSDDATFHVTASGWPASSKSYGVGWTPDVDAPDEELLLYSFFAGAPNGMGKMRQGYGLHALGRCVVDLFGGSVRIRTGHQSMTVGAKAKTRRTGSHRSYAADVRRLPGRPFHGNMLTARIPMTYDA